MAAHSRVAIVMSPDFSGALAELAQRCHVWVVDTPVNCRAAEAISVAGGEYDRTHGVTTFTVSESESTEASIVSLLPVIDDHHGLGAVEMGLSDGLRQCAGKLRTLRYRVRAGQ